MCNRYSKQQTAIRGLFKIGATLAVLILGPRPIALADDLAGQASVIDGDTLEIHGTRIRLWGVDAPESSQLCRGEDSLQYRCGTKAANDLDCARAANDHVAAPPTSVMNSRRRIASPGDYGLTIKRLKLAHSKGTADVAVGSIASGWACIGDFRSTPKNRHRHRPSACLKRAMNGPDVSLFDRFIGTQKERLRNLREQTQHI
jgi:endonuclease YncB( thermonuclease family)